MGMRTAIDGAGRVVVPKALRVALRLAAGQALEIAERDGRLEIVPAPTPMRVVDKGGRLVGTCRAVSYLERRSLAPRDMWRGAGGTSRPSLGRAVAAGRASIRIRRCRAGPRPWGWCRRAARR